MANIFISYRRADSEGYVGRLYDSLLKYYQPQEIFMDVGSLKAGEAFKARIEQVIPTCQALLAVIGPRWLHIKGKRGKRRLDNPHDFVRLEIATALRHNLLSIPVLIEGAQMPPQADLPSELAALPNFNAHELSHNRFAFDVEHLVSAIGGSFGEIKISLGVTYRSMVKARLLNPQEKIEIRVDQKLIGHIQGPGFNLGQSKSQRSAWSPVAARIEEGVHSLQAIVKSNGVSLGMKSNALKFKIKGGQKLAFIIERQTPSYGQTKIILQPYNPIYEQ